MLNVLVGILSLILAGNALGATWALVALADRWNAPWMALLIPFLLNWLLHFNQHPAGPWRALLCLLGLWVAIIQCNFIVGGALVAAHLGKPLWPWLFMIGPEMSFAVARAHMQWIDLIAYASGSVLALWLGRARRAPAGRSGRPRSLRSA